MIGMHCTFILYIVSKRTPGTKLETVENIDMKLILTYKSMVGRTSTRGTRDRNMH